MSGGPVEAGHIPVVSLKGARISGRLILAFARVHATSLLQDCYFEERPDLCFAALGFISMQRSIMPGLVGSNLRVDGHLRMTGCSFTGEVTLRGAKIAGSLLLDGAQMRPAGGFALDADRVEVAGDVLLDSGFSAQGEVRLSNARLGGSLALADADMSAPEGNGRPCQPTTSALTAVSCLPRKDRRPDPAPACIPQRRPVPVGRPA
jgi:hypothetical protein